MFFLFFFYTICLVFVGYLTYEHFYFKSKKFLSIKSSIQGYTQECNELNQHIDDLKKQECFLRKTDYGSSNYTDNSSFNFRRPALQKRKESEVVYECSLTVCRNAQQQPFKYLCKYFNIKVNEDTLAQFEAMLNDFAAVEQGKVLLKEKRDAIISSIKKELPFLILTFSKKRLVQQLGFEDIDFSQLYFPKYSFRYISAGGNSSMTCDVVLNVDNLERFVNYLAGLIKFKKSVAGQRALMTPTLREKIKKRDNYTCQKCGISTFYEPHLLLEIDHKISLAKGGLTTEENLRTLCWKCNRTKGAKCED